MRYFIVVGHKAVTTGDFKLDDIAGGAGRLDILIRCVNSAFFLSHNLRRDTELFLVLQGGTDAPKTVRMVGSELKYLNPDERSTSSLVRNALLKKLDGAGEIKASPGIYVSRSSFKDVLDSLSGKADFVYLKEDGDDIRDFAFPENPAFVLGDNKDLTEEEEAEIVSRAPSKICIGPLSLHADHCMIVVNNEMDRRSPPDSL